MGSVSYKSQSRKNSGFTLIEMMIVVAIAAILVFFAVPSFTDFLQKGRVKNAAEEIQGFIMQAKAEGVIRDQAMFVDISFDDSDPQNWCLGFIPDPDGATDCDCNDSPPSCLADVSGTQVTQVISSADFPNVGLSSNIDSTEFDRLKSQVGPGNNGTVTISSGNWMLNTVVSTLGRVKTCKPADGGGLKGVTGYTAC